MNVLPKLALEKTSTVPSEILRHCTNVTNEKRSQTHAVFCNATIAH